MSPMTDRTRQGLTIGAAALAVSVAGDILERTVPERLDLALGIGALVLAICYVLAREPELDTPHPGFGLAAGVVVVALVWRDSEVLFALTQEGEPLIDIDPSIASAFTSAGVPLTVMLPPTT